MPEQDQRHHLDLIQDPEVLQPETLLVPAALELIRENVLVFSLEVIVLLPLLREREVLLHLLQRLTEAEAHHAQEATVQVEAAQAEAILRAEVLLHHAQEAIAQVEATQAEAILQVEVLLHVQEVRARAVVALEVVLQFDVTN